VGGNTYYLHLSENPESGCYRHSRSSYPRNPFSSTFLYSSSRLECNSRSSRGSTLTCIRFCGSSLSVGQPQPASQSWWWMSCVADGEGAGAGMGRAKLGSGWVGSGLDGEPRFLTQRERAKGIDGLPVERASSEVNHWKRETITRPCNALKFDVQLYSMSLNVLGREIEANRK